MSMSTAHVHERCSCPCPVPMSASMSVLRYMDKTYRDKTFRPTTYRLQNISATVDAMYRLQSLVLRKLKVCLKILTEGKNMPGAPKGI